MKKNSIGQLEHLLGLLGGIITKKPMIVLAITLALTVWLIAGVSRLTVDTTTESLFSKDDPAFKNFTNFQKQFGRDEAIIAAIESKDIFNSEFLNELESFHKDLSVSVPHLDKVTSLVNVTSISDRDGDLLIDDLRKIWPTSPSAYAQFKNEIVSNPLYKNVVISENGEMTLVAIRSSAFAGDANVVAPRPKAADANSSALPLGQRIIKKIIALHDEFDEFLIGEEKPEKVEPAETNINTNIETYSDSDQEVATSAVDTPLNTRQLKEFVSAVEVVTARHSSEKFPIRLAGGPVVEQAHVDFIHQDIVKLVLLSIVIALVAQFFLLRRISSVFISMMIVILSLLGTLGLMGWMGWPVTPVTQALPPLLLTICVADSVHLISGFFAHYAKTNDRRISAIYALQHSGVAILFCALTTAVGFLSFSAADIVPIVVFGWLAAFGAMLAMLYTFILIPAFLSMLNVKPTDVKFVKRWDTIEKVMTSLSMSALRNPKRVYGVVFLLLLAGIPGLTRLEFSHDVLAWFPPTHEARVNTIALDKSMRASVPLEIIVDTGKTNGVSDPDFMRRLESFQLYCEQMENGVVTMGRATSIVDVLKRIHSALNQNATTELISPTADVISQELFLFESGDPADVRELVDSQFSKARITVRMSWADAAKYVPIRNQLEAKATEVFSGVGTVTVTGTVDLLSRSMISLIDTFVSSYFLSILGIGLMMILLLRSVRIGIVSLIPNLLPLYITISIMGYLRLPIDIFAVLLEGVALGLAVDDTVHFWHGVRHFYHDQKMSLVDSIKATISSFGPGIFFTTIALASGFLVFTFSAMPNLATFGVLLSLTMIIALAVEVFVGPVLLQTLDRIGWLKSTNKNDNNLVDLNSLMGKGDAHENT